MKTTISFLNAKHLLETSDCVVIHDNSGNRHVVTAFIFDPHRQKLTAKAPTVGVMLESGAEAKPITIEGNVMQQEGSSSTVLLYQTRELKVEA